MGILFYLTWEISTEREFGSIDIRQTFEKEKTLLNFAFLLTLVYNSRHDVIGTTQTCAIHTYTQEEAKPKCQLISQNSPRIESICPFLRYLFGMNGEGENKNQRKK